MLVWQGVLCIRCHMLECYRVTVCFATPPFRHTYIEVLSVDKAKVNGLKGEGKPFLALQHPSIHASIHRYK